MTSVGVEAGRGGSSVRLLVVAVLAGLALIAGVQCSDGMSTAVPMSHGTATAMPTGEQEPHPDMGTGESLTMCLVLVVAVAAAAVALTPPAVWTTVVAHVPGAATRPESAQPRAQSLAMLCALRI